MLFSMYGLSLFFHVVLRSCTAYLHNSFIRGSQRGLVLQSSWKRKYATEFCTDSDRDVYDPWCVSE